LLEVYIGERASIAKRIGQHVRYNKKASSTGARLTRRIRRALAEDRSVAIDTATAAKINLLGEERPLDMRNVAQRRFAEAAAVLTEEARDKDGQVIVLNRILKDYLVLRDDE
jgi:hypothetical protein